MGVRHKNSRGDSSADPKAYGHSWFALVVPHCRTDASQKLFEKHIARVEMQAKQRAALAKKPPSDAENDPPSDAGAASSSAVPPAQLSENRELPPWGAWVSSIIFTITRQGVELIAAAVSSWGAVSVFWAHGDLSAGEKSSRARAYHEVAMKRGATGGLFRIPILVGKDAIGAGLDVDATAALLDRWVLGRSPGPVELKQRCVANRGRISDFDMNTAYPDTFSISQTSETTEHNSPLRARNQKTIHPRFIPMSLKKSQTKHTSPRPCSCRFAE